MEFEKKCMLMKKMTLCMEFEKKRMLMNAFFGSQYNYCPVILMFHSRALNNKINILHKRYLRVTHQDKSSIFEEL